VKIRFIARFDTFVAGDVVDWQFGMADLLIKRGVAVPAEQPIEEAVLAAPVCERAVEPRSKKK